MFELVLTQQGELVVQPKAQRYLVDRQQNALDVGACKVGFGRVGWRLRQCHAREEKALAPGGNVATDAQVQRHAVVVKPVAVNVGVEQTPATAGEALGGTAEFVGRAVALVDGVGRAIVVGVDVRLIVKRVATHQKAPVILVKLNLAQQRGAVVDDGALVKVAVAIVKVVRLRQFQEIRQRNLGAGRRVDQPLVLVVGANAQQVRPLQLVVNIEAEKLGLRGRGPGGHQRGQQRCSRRNGCKPGRALTAGHNGRLMHETPLISCCDRYARERSMPLHHPY